MTKVLVTGNDGVINDGIKKAILSRGLIYGEADMYSTFNTKNKKWTLRTSKGRKRTVTAAQQKRAKIKRKNKLK